jgi:hypothetical protein
MFQEFHNGFFNTLLVMYLPVCQHPKEIKAKAAFYNVNTKVD